MGKTQNWQGWKKGKGRPCLSPVSSPLFYGSDHLGTWNRLSHPEFHILSHACRENNGQLATFYLLGFFNPFKVLILYYWHLFQITVFGWRECKLTREDTCTSTINRTFTIFIIYSIHTQVTMKTRVFASMLECRQGICSKISCKKNTTMIQA